MAKKPSSGHGKGYPLTSQQAKDIEIKAHRHGKLSEGEKEYMKQTREKYCS